VLSVGIWIGSLSLKLAQAGFMSEDDLALASLGFQGKNVFEVAAQFASQTGRFYQYFTVVTTQLPYLLSNDNQIIIVGIARVFQIFFFFTTVALFAQVLYGNKLAVAISLLSLFLVSFEGAFNSLVSYPFWISFGFGFIFLSGRFLAIFLQKPSIRRGSLFLFFYLLAICTYEANLLAFFLYAFVIGKVNNFGVLDTTKVRLKHRKILFACYMAITISYLIVYKVFQDRSEGNYAGTEVTGVNIFESARVIVNFSLAHSALNNLGNEPIVFIQEFNTTKPHILMILFLCVGISLTAVKLIEVYLSKNRISVTRKEILSISFLALLPNTLLSVTDKYRAQYNFGPYTTSLVSHVFLTILLVLVVLRLLDPGLESLSEIREKAALRKVTVFFIVFIVFATGVSQNFQNSRELVYRKSISSIWNAMEIMKPIFIKPEFSSQKRIQSSTLAVESKSGPYPYWDWFIGKSTGINYNFTTLNQDQDSALKAHRVEVFKHDFEFILLFMPENFEEDGRFYIANQGSNTILDLGRIPVFEKYFIPGQNFSLKSGLNEYILPGD
jgi:hypothetical protein